MAFSKGITDSAALLAALQINGLSKRQNALDALERPGVLQWTDPQAGIDARGRSPINPPPAISSAAMAADLLEVALLGLMADVPMDQWASDPIAVRGAETLAAFPAGILSADLCRDHGVDGLGRMHAGRRPADRVGVLLREPIPTAWGTPYSFASRRRENWYLTTEAAWRAAQQGGLPGQHPDLPAQQLGPVTPIATGRDLASLVQSDPPGSIPLAVVQQLQAARAPRSGRLPSGRNDAGFVGRLQAVEINNGPAAALSQAFRLGWRLKWIDYRLERPEELWPRAAAGELHPIMMQLGGWVFDEIEARHGDRRFLPQVYAGGCPCHSDWPSGHAIDAGVGATILKTAYADGPLRMVSGAQMASVHEAIDTAMWNVALGRVIAGIHSMGALREGMRLGQAMAVRYLDQQRSGPYVVGAVSFVGVDGRPVTITA